MDEKEKEHKTIRGMIPSEILSKWDGTRVRLFLPQNLESPPDTLIYLINKDHTAFKLWMKVDKIYFFEENKLSPRMFKTFSGEGGMEDELERLSKLLNQARTKILELEEGIKQYFADRTSPDFIVRINADNHLKFKEGKDE